MVLGRFRDSSGYAGLGIWCKRSDLGSRSSFNLVYADVVSRSINENVPELIIFLYDSMAEVGSLSLLESKTAGSWALFEASSNDASPLKYSIEGRGAL
jgi:hypothetical protein